MSKTQIDKAQTDLEAVLSFQDTLYARRMGWAISNPSTTLDRKAYKKAFEELWEYLVEWKRELLFLVAPLEI